MAELKTKRNKSSVTKFLNSVTDVGKKKDCLEILYFMEKVTKSSPEMWGDSIVGFGSYRYKYESGREGDWFLTGFSPRKQNITIYIMPGFDHYKDVLKKLGNHKTGKSCLYIKKLEDVNRDALQMLIERSVAVMSKKHNS